MSEQISAEEYHSLPGTSNSRLSDFIEDPRIYWYKYLSGKYRQPQADHFDFGSAVHEIALLGTSANIVVIPEAVLSTSGSRAGGKWKAFEAENANKMLLKQKDWDAVQRCVDSIYACKIARQLLEAPGRAECMHEAKFAELGFNLRCRPDYLLNSDAAVDLKTTQSTRADKFAKSVANFGYARQEYFYRKVLKEHGYSVQPFVFIAVSVDQPHTVDCYTLSEDWVALAGEQVEAALSDLARRTIDNDWESPTSDRIVCLSPPNWVKYQGEYLA